MIERSTLADWVGRAAFHLAPIVDRMAELLKRSSKLFMDESVLQRKQEWRFETMP
jgi:transposase